MAHGHELAGRVTKVGSRLPRFPDERAAEGRGLRELLTRAVAVLALAVTVVYLMWRVVATIDLRVWWLSIPLLVLELHAAVGLGLYVSPSGMSTPGLGQGRCPRPRSRWRC
jgi:hypothetical protein